MIVNDLHGDTPSLKACSLVAHAFVPATRVNIFNTVYLLPPSRRPAAGSEKQLKTYCEKFDALLTLSPHLAPLVKDLRLVEGIGHEMLSSEIEMVGRAPGVPWMATSARALVAVLARLNLTRFSILCKYNGAEWDRLPRGLTSAILDVLRSPGLESVRLLGIRIANPQPIVDMLSGANKLKELAIQWSNEPRQSATEAVNVSADWRPQLESLAVSDYFATLHLAFPGSNIDFSRLRTLSVHGLRDPLIRAMLKLLPRNNVVESLNIWHPTR